MHIWEEYLAKILMSAKRQGAVLHLPIDYPSIRHNPALRRPADECPVIGYSTAESISEYYNWYGFQSERWLSQFKQLFFVNEAYAVLFKNITEAVDGLLLIECNHQVYRSIEIEIPDDLIVGLLTGPLPSRRIESMERAMKLQDFRLVVSANPKQLLERMVGLVKQD